MGPRGMRMGIGEGVTMRNFIVGIVHSIVTKTKSRRLRWAGHVARREEGRNAFKMFRLTGLRVSVSDY